MRKLTPRDVQKIMERHAFDVWQQIPVDNFCMGIAIGDPDPCIQIQVAAGCKDKVPKSVILDTEEFGKVEIALKVTEDYIPMHPQIDTRMGV